MGAGISKEQVLAGVVIIVVVALSAWAATNLRRCLRRVKKMLPDVEIRLTSILDPKWQILVPPSQDILQPGIELRVAFIGEYNAGKTFTINRLFGLNLHSEGLTTRTEAITMKRTVMGGVPFNVIDTAGVHTPVTLDVGSVGHQVLSKRSTETFLRDVTFGLADVVIVVVNRSSFPMLEYIWKLRKLGKELWLIHNFKDATAIEAKDLFQSEVANVWQCEPQSRYADLLYVTRPSDSNEKSMMHTYLTGHGLKSGRDHNARVFQILREKLYNLQTPASRDPVGDVIKLTTGRSLRGELAARNFALMHKHVLSFEDEDMEILKVDKDAAPGEGQVQGGGEDPLQVQYKIQAVGGKKYNPNGHGDHFSFQQLHIPSSHESTEHLKLFTYSLPGLGGQVSRLCVCELKVENFGRVFTLRVNATARCLSTIFRNCTQGFNTLPYGQCTETVKFQQDDFVYFASWKQDGLLFVLCGAYPSKCAGWQQLPDVLKSLSEALKHFKVAELNCQLRDLSIVKSVVDENVKVISLEDVHPDPTPEGVREAPLEDAHFGNGEAPHEGEEAGEPAQESTHNGNGNGTHRRKTAQKSNPQATGPE